MAVLGDGKYIFKNFLLYPFCCFLNFLHRANIGKVYYHLNIFTYHISGQKIKPKHVFIQITGDQNNLEILLTEGLSK